MRSSSRTEDLKNDDYQNKFEGQDDQEKKMRITEGTNEIMVVDRGTQ